MRLMSTRTSARRWTQGWAAKIWEDPGLYDPVEIVESSILTGAGAPVQLPQLQL